jgi:pantetheine-phosphate adenylyltransferase
MARTALYTGSFDPLTNGHIDVIEAATGLCDRLIVAIGVHPSKTPMFDVAERTTMIEEECGGLAAASGCVLEVATFDDLSIEAARRFGATIIIRGLRDTTDFDYEMQMVGMNAAMAPELRTVFIPASAQTRAISATLVRQIAAMAGDVSPFVPARVAESVRGKRNK